MQLPYRMVPRTGDESCGCVCKGMGGAKVGEQNSAMCLRGRRKWQSAKQWYIEKGMELWLRGPLFALVGGRN